MKQLGSNENGHRKMIIYSVIVLLLVAAVIVLGAVALKALNNAEDGTRDLFNDIPGEMDMVDTGEEAGDTQAAEPGMTPNGESEDRTATGDSNEQAEDRTSSDTDGKDTSEAADMSEDQGENGGDPQTQVTEGAEVDISKLGNQNAEASDTWPEVATYGIDVAKWQGIIDWSKVKASGVEFAVIRVGYRTLDKGIIVADPYAEYNLQQASKYKIKIGVYFFSTAVNKEEALEEARWVADFIAPYPITYPVVFNCEGFNDSNNRQYGMTLEERTEIAIAFLNYIEEQGYTPMFYAAKNELESNAQWDADKLGKKYMIWVARYTEDFDPDTSVSGYSGKHQMWQYTSNGRVEGINKAVDLNVAYFQYDRIAEPKDTSEQKEATADPAALINFKEVNEKVTAKIETNLRSVPSNADSDTVAAVLKNGDVAKRTGIGDNGWSRVEYDGKTLYAVTSYLTTDLTKPTEAIPEEKEPDYKEVKEKVTAKEVTNLRSEPSADSDDTIVEVLRYGEVATRTGIGDNGWSRVEYNGKVLYALSNYLTTDLNYQESKTPSLENPEAGINFTEVNEKVTAKEVTNLRLVPSSESKDTIAAVLNNGDIAKRTGISDNGWSRVEYKGKILYAVTSYLKAVE